MPDPLAPQLAEAERTLETMLDEACGTRPLTQADTGELIRIEEMLAIASDAAKKAISIRRKRRQRGRPPVDSPSGGVAAQMSGLEAAPSGTHRVFVDGHGERWDIWAVYPKARGTPSSVLRGTFREGWLCLESPSQKRRLSPIPSEWESLSEQELGELCAKADVVAPRGP
jgi:hypothetical protein